MKKFLIIGLLIMQLSVIVYLGWKIWRNYSRNSVLGTVITNPINKENVQIDATHSAELSYFYEPVPDKIETEIVVGSNTEVRYHINHDALNSLRDYSIDKPPFTYRIVTLGDSYTFGHFVDTANNYPSQLEELLNAKPPCAAYTNFEVINLGMKGYDLRYSVERYKKRGMKYQPDLVIWYVKSDDFNQIQDEIFVAVEQLVRLGHPRFNEQTRKWEAHMLAAQELKEKRGEAYIYVYQRQTLDSIRTYYHNPLLFLAILPKDHQIILNEFVATDGLSEVVSDISFNENERFIDGHLNKIGNEKVARRLFDVVSQKVKATCN